MAKRLFFSSLIVFGAFFGAAMAIRGQQDQSNDTIFHVTVNLVQLDVAVTDKKGNYVTGLPPSAFAVYEDGIEEKVATYEEGNEPPRILGQTDSSTSRQPVSTIGPSASGHPLHEASSSMIPLSGASVFILFDTSNYMYRGFVYAQDAIAEFVRSLDHPSRVAFYSYSRSFSRPSLLTPDVSTVLHGIRATVAGDDAALYDALLMTLKDAGPVKGRRVVVVFSNGPDDASMVSPEDVRELAQSEGVPIYMICTQQARLEPISTAVFQRMSASTGGLAYFAKDWQDQQRAFGSIRDDLEHLYSLSYYPRPNPNVGWRTISVKLSGEQAKKYHIRARSGYRPKTSRQTALLLGVPLLEAPRSHASD